MENEYPQKMEKNIENSMIFNSSLQTLIFSICLRWVRKRKENTNQNRPVGSIWLGRISDQNLHRQGCYFTQSHSYSLWHLSPGLCKAQSLCYIQWPYLQVCKDPQKGKVAPSPGKDHIALWAHSVLIRQGEKKCLLTLKLLKKFHKQKQKKDLRIVNDLIVITREESLSAWLILR